MQFIEEKPRQTPVKKVADVLVIGGGSAGITAAVAAARGGASVLLVERYGFLGGVMTSVSLGSLCGLYTVDGDQVIPVVEGIASEMTERLRHLGGAGQPKRWLRTASLPYDLFAMKLAADDLVRGAGVNVVFHSHVVDVVVQEGRITGVILEGKSGRWVALGSVVIDCSGDGDVAAMAGAEFEFDLESLQFPTTMFRFGGVDADMVRTIDREQLRSHLDKAVAAGMDLPRTAGGMFTEKRGIVHLNITRVNQGGRAPNPLDPFELTEAEIAGRQQVSLYQKAFRDFVPGFRDCYILDTGAQIGVRESRRIKGEYWLTVGDVLSEARFPDAIACCAWPVEDHGADRSTKWVWLSPGGYYQIPFRCLVPGGVRGLLVAGRCVSASHDAQASLRVAAQCMAMGQAAGIAAAQVVISGVDVREVPIARIQSALLQEGAFLGPLDAAATHANTSDQAAVRAV